MIGIALAAILAVSELGTAARNDTALERFQGERDLLAAVARHGVDGRLLLDELDPDGRHARFVEWTAAGWGIPKDQIDVGTLSRLPRESLVGTYSVIAQAHSGAAHLEKSEVRRIQDTGAIVVAGAGNPGEGRAGKGGHTVHYLVPEHQHWNSTQGRVWWNRAFGLMEHGQLIIARASRWDGNKWEENTSVHCGHTMQWCYTIRARNQGLGEGSTSKAAVLLASLILVLTEVDPEPVQALNECAIDIGRPGIDPVFGRGLVQVDCERIQQAIKIRVANQSDGRGQT